METDRFEKLWEQCQIIYKGVIYNLATDDFYKYIDYIIKEKTKTVT